MGVEYNGCIRRLVCVHRGNGCRVERYLETSESYLTPTILNQSHNCQLTVSIHNIPFESPITNVRYVQASPLLLAVADIETGSGSWGSIGHYTSGPEDGDHRVSSAVCQYLGLSHPFNDAEASYHEMKAVQNTANAPQSATRSNGLVLRPDPEQAVRLHFCSQRSLRAQMKCRGKTRLSKWYAPYSVCDNDPLRAANG